MRLINIKDSSIRIFLIVLFVFGSLLIYADYLSEKTENNEKMSREEMHRFIDQELNGAPYIVDIKCDIQIGKIKYVKDIYYAINGSTGQLFTYAYSADRIINWSIDNLTQSGKIYFRNTTYLLNSPIVDNGKNDIELHLASSAILRISKNVNDDNIELKGVNGWWIHGGKIDGNKKNQNAVNTEVIEGINLEDCDFCKISEIFIYNTKAGGVFINEGEHNKIVSVHTKNTGWNGISLGRFAYNNHVYQCKVEGCSDVGISTYGEYNLIEDNIVFNITGNDGFRGRATRWGIGIEYDNIYLDGSEFDEFRGNLINGSGLKRGFAGSDHTLRPILINNTVINAESHIESDRAILRDNKWIGGSSSWLLWLNGNDVSIIGDYFESKNASKMGLLVEGENAFVDECIFIDSTD